MGQALYVERGTYPLVIPGDEVMFLSRNKGTPAAPPRLYIVALTSATEFEVVTGNGPMVSSFSNTISGSGALEKGQTEVVTLVSAVNNDHCVYVVRCLAGQLAVSIVSPHPVEMQFRSRGQ